MKKLLLTLLLFFVPFFVKAESKIEVTDVKVVEKSGTITIGDLKFHDQTVDSNIVFNQLNDFVTFEVELENTSGTDYKLNSITSNLDSDYIDIISEDQGRTIKRESKEKVRVKLKYVKELINEEQIELNNTKITFDFSAENVENPYTESGASKYIIIGISIIALSFFVIKYKKIKFLYVLLLVPITVLAMESITSFFTINNITIKGRMIEYAIVLKDGDTILDEREIEYGELLGDLPTYNKPGYYFENWTDANGNIVTENTIIQSDLVIIPNYKPIEYSINYDLKGGMLSKQNPETYTIEDEFTLNNPTKEGYSFSGWSEDGETYQTSYTIFRGTMGNKSFVARYSPNQDTLYTVIHEQMDLNGNYVETEREELHGATDTEVTPQPKVYEGFKTPASQTVTISGDGQTEVIYKYERIKYQLNIENFDGFNVQESTPNGEYYYGYTVHLEAENKKGYTIKWSDYSTEYSRDITVNNNIILSAQYIPNTHAEYKVIHKQMNLDGETYTTKDEEIFYGLVNDTVKPSVNIYEGFTSPEAEELIITADGEASVTYYYTRNKYTLTLIEEEYIETTTPSGEYYYGTEITLNAKDKNGKSFSKWSNDVTDNPYTFILTDNITLTAIRDVPVTETIYWSLDGTGSKYLLKLTISDRPVSGKKAGSFSGYTVFNSPEEVPWVTSDYDVDHPELILSYKVSTVEIQGKVAPVSTAYWFAWVGCHNEQDFRANLSNLDTSNVTDMSYMFYEAGYGNRNYSFRITGMENWDTSKVTNMSNMFNQAGRIVSSWSIGDISNWDVSNVKDMSGMFFSAANGATTLRLDLSKWNTSSVENVDRMFNSIGWNASTLELNLSGWDLSNVTNTDYMFYYAGQTAKTVNIDLSDWDTSNITSMQAMFERVSWTATSFRLDLSNWNTSNVENMINMFQAVAYRSTNPTYIIPKTNGNGIDNTTTKLYGKDSETYATLSFSNHSFTLQE